MIYFLIGHRGVGKTSALNCVENGVDLDAEISKVHNIREFFETKGEKKFRTLEMETLKNVLETSQPSYVSLGAGFELDKFNFPENSKFIWIQRKSDREGRIFLDRPKLEKDKGSVEEFAMRREVRNKFFEKYANFTVEFEEGESEDDFLQTLEGREGAVGTHGFYTLVKKEELEFLNVNIEVRSDIFKSEEIIKILDKAKSNLKLVALRSGPDQVLLDLLKTRTDVLIDVPVEIKEQVDLSAFESSKVIISEHDFISSDEIKELNAEGHHVKWAPEVESFQELIEYHESAKGLDVSFLPRSVGEILGRWNWYRQVTFWNNKITFFRFGLNNYMDQPAHYEVKLKAKENAKYAAVLGGDVSLSHSPSFHRDFIHQNFGGAYLHISLYPDEFLPENLSFMKSLNIRFFSVTSPFKRNVGEFLKSDLMMNTLYLGPINRAVDTDSNAVKALSKELSGSSRVLVWGSGAMGQSIYKELGEKATLQSIRSYNEGSLKSKEFEVLIWAAGADCLVYPELKMIPSVIYDLEYKEHSQAREVALAWGCDYISGHEFFKTQALAQQEFWVSSDQQETQQ